MKVRSLLFALLALVGVSSIAYAATNYDDLLTFRAGIVIGTSGTQIDRSYAGSQTIDIASIPANTCVDQTAITVTGATANDACFVGPPAAITTGLVLTCFVSAADAVKIRACATNGAAAVDPASATYTVRTFDP